MMRERLKTLVDRINKSADQLRQSDNLMSETLHGIADELEAAIQPQWVPVGERLPETGVEVFGLCFGSEVEVVRWSAQWQRFLYETDVCADGVTHWHEIDYPEPPEAKS